MEATPDAPEDTWHLSASSAIRESAILTPSAKQPVLHQRFARKHHFAEVALNSIPLVLPSDPLELGPLLVSLGPNSDVILNRFDLGDHLLPRLHVLVRTVCNGHWKATLRATPWNLTFEQASNLS